MYHHRTESRCSLCPLNGKKKVVGVSPDVGRPLFAIFGEAPGADEENLGVPFVGASGSMLNWALKTNNINRNMLFISNVIACRPPENDINSNEGKYAIPACRSGFFVDLEYLASNNVTTIMALGATASKAFGIDTPITKARGSVYTYVFNRPSGETFKFFVIPTYHPSYVIRKHWKKSGGGTADNAVAWLSDFEKAARIAKDGWEKPKEEFNLSPTPQDVENFVARAIKENRRIGLDTETTSLNRSLATIVVLGLADSPTSGICIPFRTAPNMPAYTASGWARIEKALNKLFQSDVPFVVQNALYDLPILRRLGFPVNPDHVDDTIMLHHTISPEAEHNLGFITSIYGETPYWKETFLSKEGSIWDMDPTELRTYNMRDCVVLLQIYDRMVTDIKKMGLWDFYNEEVKPLLAPVLEMTERGIYINLTKLHKWKQGVEKHINSLHSKLLELGNLPSEFNLDSTDDMRWFLYGQPSKKFERLDELSSITEQFALRERMLREAKAALNEFESVACPPNCSTKEELKWVKKRDKLIVAVHKAEAQLNRMREGKKYQEYMELLKLKEQVKPLYDVTKAGYQLKETETGLAAVNSESLLMLKSKLLNRRETIKEFTRKDGSDELQDLEKLLNWLNMFEEYRKTQKLLSSFTKYSPDLDGRIRPNWKMAGTATGRLSCQNPNLMQLPKASEDEGDLSNAVRDFFEAAPGYSFISCDYVNLEVYILAFETLDPGLLLVTDQGLNIHDLNTKSLFGIDETHPKWKSYRKAAKVFQFGRLQYGGSDEGVYEKVLIQAPDADLTLAQFKEASKRWFSEHEAYVKWYETLKEEVLSTRQTKTGFGRIRTFLGNESGIIREALSTRIQGSAASLVNRAMRRIFDRVRQEGLTAYFVLQVHDQLVMEVKDEHIERVKQIMVEEMQRPFMFRGFERRVAVDPSVGKTFGEV